MADDKMITALCRALFDHNVLILWKPAYELKIPVIDEQHRTIVAIINSLFYAIQNGHGEKMLTSISNIMCEYTRIHFELEEDYLIRCDFFEMTEHKRLHAELVDKLIKFGEEDVRGQAPTEFLNFLKEWWLEHICVKDMVFRNYLAGMRG